MHILIIPSERLIPEDAPVAGIFQYHQATALHRAGIRVGIIAPAPWDSGGLRERIRRLGLGGVTDHRFPFGALVNQSSSLWPGRFSCGMQLLWDRVAFRLFHRYAASYGMPDLVHAHNVLFAGCFCVRLLDRFRVPYVITEHSSQFSNGSIKVNRRIRETYLRASARLMVSPFLGTRVEAMVGHEATPWECVPNLLPRIFESTSSQNKVLSGRFRFLCIAQFVPVKNHMCLLKAFAMAFRGRDAELILGGDGPLISATKEFADELGISPQVSFLGFQSRKQVIEEMQRCDVLVLPSHHETFGVVLIEAMSCGKPVIAPSGSGPDAIVTPDNGSLFAPGDPNALASAMNNIFTKYNRFDSKSIRYNCIARYGEETVVSQLINLYSRVLNDQSSI